MVCFHEFLSDQNIILKQNILQTDIIYKSSCKNSIFVKAKVSFLVDSFTALQNNYVFKVFIQYKPNFETK